MLGVRAGKMGAVPRGPYNLLSLFSDGEEGGIYIMHPDSMYQDSAKTTAVASAGDPIGASEDQSSNDNDVLQATADARAIYRTDGTYHRAEFDGIDDVLVASLPSTDIAGGSAFLSCAIQMQATDGNDDFIFSIGNSGAIRPFFSIRVVNGAWSHIVADAGGIVSTQTAIAVDTEPHVLTLLYRDDTLYFRLDGAQIAEKAYNAAASTEYDRLSFGALVRDTTGNYAEVDVFGGVAVLSNASDTEVHSAEQTLARLAGITV